MSRKARNKKHEAAGKHAGTATVAPPSMAAPANDHERRPAAERTWLEEAWRRMSRILGSLQVAVILLAIFAVVLALGTMAESWYNSRVAQELVYRTWWFQLLLLLLGANILFAALKKWPWKKHQTGFLITHLGLLAMVAGGVWTALSGTDAVTTMIDSDDRSLRESIGAPRVTRNMILLDEQDITVRRIDKPEDKGTTYTVSPGSFTWRSDDHLEVEMPVFTSILSWLAHPIPHHWSRDLGNGASLNIENHYPHTRSEPFSRAQRAEGSFPALRVQMWSPMGRVPPFWLSLSSKPAPGKREWPYIALGPALAELLGRCPDELVDEFLQPPKPEELGPKGQLVIHFEGKRYRLPVEPNLGRLVPLGTTGCTIRPTRYQAALGDSSGRQTEPSDPGVYFEFTNQRGGTGTYLAPARMNSRGGALDNKGEPGGTDLFGLKYWYHPPDHRYGRGQQQRGLLQFVQTSDGKLHYRSFHQDAGAFRLEASGLALAPAATAQKSELITIWKAMKFKFQVQEYLAEADDEERLVPENHRPGLQRADLSTALRCKLKNKNETTEFWIAQGERRVVRAGGERFSIAYNIKTQDMGFELKLLRAEQRTDDGAQSAATYTSFVQVTDDGEFSHPFVPEFLRPLTNFVGLTAGGVRAQGEDHVITMNEPLEWDGYKVFQSQYDFKDWDSRERPVSLSGFTVSRDPGLFLKYLGSSMLALGIACMFYMKAYFLTGRPRTPAVSANGPLPKEKPS